MVVAHVKDVLRGKDKETIRNNEIHCGKPLGAVLTAPRCPSHAVKATSRASAVCKPGSAGATRLAVLVDFRLASFTSLDDDGFPQAPEGLDGDESFVNSSPV